LALRSDKLKAILTMLGIVVGTASLVIVVTIVTAGKGYISRQIEGVGANLAYATLDRGGNPIPADELTPFDLKTIRETVPELAKIAGTYDLPIEMVVGDRVRHARLVGVTDEFQSIRQLKVTAGRYFDEEDFSTRARACLITEPLAKESFGSETATGDVLRIGDFRCTVIGTFKEGVPTFGRSEIQNETVLVPFPLIRDMNGDSFFQVIYAQANSPQDVPAMTDRIEALIRSHHRPEARYSVENMTSLLATANQISLAMAGVTLGVAMLILTTAGIGIMNIMLFTVTQRTREIGLRKALGARPAEIRMQFLFEAVFISLAGALIGFASGATLVWLAAQFAPGPIPIGISWVSVPFALLVPSAVGVLFGYRPARQAARLNAIDALRAD
jgi:putative ABC transport system permease protein